ARVYAGNFTRYESWQQVVDLTKNAKPVEEPAEVTELNWSRVPEGEDDPKNFGVVWHGKFVQPREGAVRFGVTGNVTALTINGQLELELGPGGRTCDVHLAAG